MGEDDLGGTLKLEPEAARLLNRVVLITGNPNKLAEARRLCGARLQAVETDLPEIQSLDLREVLRAKAEEGWRHLERPLVVEETALELAAFNGFPGPLVKWMLAAVGAEGIARAAHRAGNDRATARCALLLRHESGTVVGEGLVEGRLVLPPRGNEGFGWDPVFQPLEASQTFGELSADEKDRIGHRGRAWRALLAKLKNLPLLHPG